MKLTSEQISFAQYLNEQYGRPTAKRYLKLVSRPDYLSQKNLGYSKQSHTITETLRRKKTAGGEE